MDVVTVLPLRTTSTYTGLVHLLATILKKLLRPSTILLPSVYSRREHVSKNAHLVTKTHQYNATRPEPWLVIQLTTAASTRLAKNSSKNGALILKLIQEARSTHLERLSITGIPPSNCTASVFLISILHKSALSQIRSLRLFRNYSTNL